MREVLFDLADRVANGETVGVGTVVATFSSAPRPPGAAMLVTQDGEAIGSVSGGCVEGAVHDLAQGTDVPVLQRFGVSDDDAFAVGLTCGGIIDIYVEKIDATSFPELGEVAEAVRSDKPVAVATVVEHPSGVGRRMVVWPDRSTGSLGTQRVDEVVADDARGMLASGRSGVLRYGPDGRRRGEGLSVFVNAFEPPPRMLVFGAIDFAAAMARLGAFLGYRVTVCDARPVFATRTRFPEADDVIVAWPHKYLEAEKSTLDRRTVIAVLTHDPKFDVPLLEVALRLDVGYIGAMGSRRTHDDRLERLREAGLTDGELARLASPIGLDLGGRTPEETAVSIAAEIISLRWNGTGRRLTDLDRPIHR
ncbi:XdhC family protein [Lentzea sp. NPDC058450]|uniref:XdhC family protein n=1 Tax=Lentzea sp. NPDC058450 TaxID=3346505 RepID=UPI00366536CB